MDGIDAEVDMGPPAAHRHRELKKDEVPHLELGLWCEIAVTSTLHTLASGLLLLARPEQTRLAIEFHLTRGQSAWAAAFCL